MKSLIVYLHKDLSHAWSIRNNKDEVIHIFNAKSEEDAIKQAHAWASSWHYVEVKLVDKPKA